jgi:UDP-glucose 4-epimerase
VSLEGPILITGGLGYVGGRLASHLRSAHPELEIRLLSRSPRPEATWAKGFSVVKGDFLDSASLGSALEGVKGVVHLAAPNEIASAQDPGMALEVMGKGTLGLLEECYRAGVARVIYMSTFHVYNASAGTLITEETLLRPVHPYGISHYLAEMVVNMFRSRGLETLIFRLSNGYGYPMDTGVDRWTLVFNDLCRQAAKDKELVLKSSGVAHRDFISLEDVGRAVNHFLTMPPGSWEDGLYNLGGDCSMSILQMAEIIAKVAGEEMGRRVLVTPGPSHPSEKAVPVKYSINRIRAKGFHPRHNLEEEVQRTLGLCSESVQRVT